MNEKVFANAAYANCFFMPRLFQSDIPNNFNFPVKNYIIFFFKFFLKIVGHFYLAITKFLALTPINNAIIVLIAHKFGRQVFRLDIGS